MWDSEPWLQLHLLALCKNGLYTIIYSYTLIIYIKGIYMIISKKLYKKLFLFRIKIIIILVIIINLEYDIISHV